MITISEITNDADFQSLQEAWDTLLNKSSDQNPFLSFEWVSSYREHLPQGELFVLTAEQNNEIRCIAPLCIIHRQFLGMRVRVASFISTTQTNTIPINPLSKWFGTDNRLGWSDQADFAYDPNHLEALHETIRYLKKSDQWDVLDLREMPPESLIPDLLNDEFEKNQHWHEYFEGIFSKNVLMPEGYESFKKSLKRKIKKNINLYANRLEKVGGVEFRHYQTADQIDQIFPALVALEEKGRKALDETGALVQTKNRNLHEAFSRKWALKGRTHIFTLEREQEVLSYFLVLQSKAVGYGQSTAINPEYEQCSPGFNVIVESLKVLSAQGLQTVNLGRAYGLVISALSNDKQPRVWVKVIRKTFCNRLLHFVEYRLRPRVKIVSAQLKEILKKFFKNQ